MPDLEGQMMAENSLATIDTRVGVLEREVGEVNTRLVNMDEKFDKVMAGFASEFRAALQLLTTQFTERNKTPWGVLLSGASLVLTIVIVVGGLAFAPLRGELSTVENEIVPRKEVEFRYGINNSRLSALEARVMKIRDSELERLHQEVNTLRQQNDLLRSVQTRKD